MKKQMMKISAGLLLVLGLQFSFAGSANAQESKGNAINNSEQAFTMNVEYAGTDGAQPSFRLNFANQSLKNPVMVIKDASAERLYSETITSDAVKKRYQLNEMSGSDAVTFELYDGSRKVYSKTFRISQVTETRIAVTESR